MNQPVARYLELTFIALIVALLGSGLVAAQGIPNIPHPLEGRDDCRVCHEEGLAGAPQFPADHVDRPSEICRDCHQPVEPGSSDGTSAAIPAIPHALEGRDNCLACHGTGLVGFPQVPVDHAGRTDDICQACHQVSDEVAHGLGLPEYPIIPHPLEKRDDCRACHTTGAAEAPQFPANHAERPNEICRGCHRPDSPELVTRNCLDCHIVGSSAPEPEQPAEVMTPAIPHPFAGHENCVVCHQEGVGRAPRFPENHLGLTNDICQICHQPAPPPAAMPVPTPITTYPWPKGVNTCRNCHLRLGGEQADLVTQWEGSIHAKRNVACVDCHGGNPVANLKGEAKSSEADYIGRPAKADIPALCASCHSDVERMRQYNLPTDQFTRYQESVHAFLLGKGDRNVATCYDCHGGHQTLPVNDPASPVHPYNVPALCASCHADQAVMAAYSVPTDQYDLYRQSVHGQALLDKQDLQAPTCATCHSNHGAAPPGFGEAANICGSCHATAQEHYLQSPHAGAGRDTPACVTCHGRYDVSKPSEALFLGSEPRHCGACHPPESEPGQVAQKLHDELASAAQAFEEAAATLQAARRTGMPVVSLEERLEEANAMLISARTVQHTLNFSRVRDRVDKTRLITDEVKSEAASIVSDSIFRRWAMAVALLAIGLALVALYSLKQTLGRQLTDD